MEKIKGSYQSIKTYLATRFHSRLRVVPHFSSGIVERAKLKRAWKSPHAAFRLFSRGVIFTRTRVSLALVSLRKNGGLLVVYFRSTILLLRPRCKTCFSSPPPSLFGVASLLLAITEIAYLLSFLIEIQMRVIFLLFTWPWDFTEERFDLCCDILFVVKMVIVFTNLI